MKNIRTRFAPSPTGLMHIGNIRTALLNYLFAKKNNGTTVLRIEDTDSKRDFDPGAKHIQAHLKWLGLKFDEGPETGGQFKPYFQSKRNDIYQKHLEFLKENNFVYKCFCTQEELDTKRQRQIALKKPPRYDGTCLKITAEQIQKKIDKNIPFVWRMKVDPIKKISFRDLARGELNFDLKNFSDFPLTRADESFTFMFANCVDDFEMEISHVLRGEDHLTNSVGQVVLLQAFEKTIPTFWHLSILCNTDGKKLSKRDQGFSLEDLKAEGFLPEAICNYLGIIGVSFKDEIMSLDQLAANYNFEKLHTTSQIKYDIEKLKWINHKWIAKYDIDKLVLECKPFLEQAYDLSETPEGTLKCLISAIQTDLQKLSDVSDILKFFFSPSTSNNEKLKALISNEKIIKLKKIFKSKFNSWQEFFNNAKQQAKESDISNKELFSSIRILLTGSEKGLQIKSLFNCLGTNEFFNRLNKI